MTAETQPNGPRERRAQREATARTALTIRTV